jgi:hypothetical protein
MASLTPREEAQRVFRYRRDAAARRIQKFRDAVAHTDNLHEVLTWDGEAASEATAEHYVSDAIVGCLDRVGSVKEAHAQVTQEALDTASRSGTSTSPLANLYQRQLIRAFAEAAKVLGPFANDERVR